MSDCKHLQTNRIRVAPTSREKWSILVDKCLKCKALIPVHPDELTTRQADWVERWNRRLEDVEMLKIEERV